jgi:hypothetical protein
MNSLRPELPPPPPRMARRPIDHRGYTVPWFVEVVDGIPDHRLTSDAKRERALRERRCWLCGERLGPRSTFVIGPMCCLTRTTSEPGCHEECAEWAVRACPFLTRPHAHRRAAGLPEDIHEAPGVGLKRNPGAVALWTCRGAQPFHVQAKPGIQPGTLVRLSQPTRLDLYAEGRKAGPDQLLASLLEGVPVLVADSGATPSEAGSVWTDVAMLWTELAHELARLWPPAAVAMIEASHALPELIRRGLEDGRRARSAAAVAAGAEGGASVAQAQPAPTDAVVSFSAPVIRSI